MRQKVRHFCKLFNLETPDGREQYANTISDVASDPACINVTIKDIQKKYKTMGQDGGYEEEQLWKLVEWDVTLEKKEKKIITKEILDEII